MKPDREGEAHERRHEARVLLFGAIVLFFAGLLGCAVLVGLWRNTIDPTGTVSILAGVISLIAGLLLRGGGEK